jgi:glycosyltransferase involved in cell wall biosynthesis
MVGGSAVLMSNLLAAYPGTVRVLAGHYPMQDPNFKPPVPTSYVRPPRLSIAEKVHERLVNKFPLLIRPFATAVARKFRPDVIMGVFPHPAFFIESYRIAKKWRLPFYAYMHDLWEENYPPGDDRRLLAERWEREILGHAKRVVCMTSTQRDFYREKYGIEADILPHSVPETDLGQAPSTPLEPSPNPPTVLFVGNQSPHMNLDALRVLAKSADLWPEGVELVMLTNRTIEQLAAQGIESSRLRAEWVSREECKRRMASAHILVAPLSHKNCSHDEVRTVFSTKLLEYLVSGRPILVFAPPDSFHALSAKQEGWGFVVDQDSPAALADGVARLLADRELVSGLVRAAGDEARRRNSASLAQQLFNWVQNDSRLMTVARS